MANWKKILHDGNVVPGDLAVSSADTKLLGSSGGNLVWRQQVSHIQMQWSCRWYTDANTGNTGDNRRKWYTPSSTYGPSYYQWNSYSTGEDPRQNWYDSYNPCIYIPYDMALRQYTARGNITWPQGTTQGNLLLELRKNEDPVTWSGDPQTTIDMEVVGTRQTSLFTSSNYGTIGENGNWSLLEGDILVPYLARDSLLDNSNYYYLECVFILEFEKKIT